MKEVGGGGEGRKRLQIENLRSPANAAPDWLGYLTCVDQRFVPI